MISPIYFAETASSSGSPLEALGVNGGAFLIQLVTFLFVFLILKKFAFTPIVKMLEERRKTIDDGVRMGVKMEKEKAKLDEDVKQVIREARLEADKIIATGHKEAREIARESEKAAQRKGDAMIADAQARIEEEKHQAKRKLEKEIVGLVSEATETIVHEKVDSKKDAELINKAIKGRE